jgi:1-acyl-sn-glycerol-3-phosphate acyltransferase
MMEAIKRERLVGIFPEGTTRRRVDAKAGAVRFAELTKKLLLPVNIRARGPYPPRYPFRFPTVTVAIGTPFPVGELARDLDGEGARSERYRLMSEQLMRRVDTA